MSAYQPLTQLPAVPAGYDVVANSGWLGASKLYTALLATLSGPQAEIAAKIMDDLRERDSARLQAACEVVGAATYEVKYIAVPVEGTTANAA